MAVISLMTVAAVLSLTLLSSSRAQAQAASVTTTQVTTQTQNVQKAKQQQAEVTRLRQSIRFFIETTSRLRAVAGQHTSSNHAERRTSSIGFLRWDKWLWHGRLISAKHYLWANPWANMLRRTKAYRACLIRDESLYAGIYKAQNSRSTASGAYQFLDSTWQPVFAKAKEYFKGKLKGEWTRAIYAPPKVQDIVAAYDIVAAIVNHHPNSWQHPDCDAIGVLTAR